MTYILGRIRKRQTSARQCEAAIELPWAVKVILVVVIVGAALEVFLVVNAARPM